MRWFVADFHVHTLLSPCAAVEMTPHHLVLLAQQAGIDILGITDHNAGDNVRAALEAARGAGIAILPGMEVESREEAHFLTLFDTPEQLMAWEQIVDRHRSGLKNDDRRFGAQFIVDAADNLLGVKEELLLSSLTLGAEQVADAIASLGGLTIASHVDRPMYSILAQLGFIPPKLNLQAVEVSRRVRPAEAASMYPGIERYPIITSSDAHTAEDFLSGPKVRLWMEAPTISEIRQALLGINGRRMEA